MNNTNGVILDPRNVFAWSQIKDGDYDDEDVSKLGIEIWELFLAQTLTDCTVVISPPGSGRHFAINCHRLILWRFTRFRSELQNSSTSVHGSRVLNVHMDPKIFLHILALAYTGMRHTLLPHFVMMTDQGDPLADGFSHFRFDVAGNEAPGPATKQELLFPARMSVTAQQLDFLEAKVEPGEIARSCMCQHQWRNARPCPLELTSFDPETLADHVEILYEDYRPVEHESIPLSWAHFDGPGSGVSISLERLTKAFERVPAFGRDFANDVFSEAKVAFPKLETMFP
ncbi:hypothetical protein Dda_0071 [Drechslerella dactyloides]|uniref:BTB domain-containing protein n=1 Tax=Drechslerella dactyloides TaxID=74499 RepID=A0AAD6NMD9_DREDA|nr:hypothetical protein Dda_0071 [Drechslerella dactyloides]